MGQCESRIYSSVYYTQDNYIEQADTEIIFFCRAGMPGYVWDYFAPSVKMSSYLVAFLVSDFINIPAKPGVSNVQFRIWARANAANITSCVFIILITFANKISLLDFNNLSGVNGFFLKVRHRHWTENSRILRKLLQHRLSIIETRYGCHSWFCSW